MSKDLKKVDEALSTLIWNYRLSRAKDWTVPEATLTTGSEIRFSKIASRMYQVIDQPPGAKPYTSKAGLACYKIIVDVCGGNVGGTCTEGDLKKAVVERGLEITPTHTKDPTSAWRFLQFYRPLLVEAGLLIYTK
jgi:hypothetical protein